VAEPEADAAADAGALAAGEDDCAGPDGLATPDGGGVVAELPQPDAANATISAAATGMRRLGRAMRGGASVRVSAPS
jgi:hypothetical protein